MIFLKILLLVVEIVSCLLLIGVILLQKPKSEGMGLAFGSGMGEALFGSRAGNVLTRVTITLAIIFLATTTLLGSIYGKGSGRSLMDQRVADAPQVSQPAPAPAGEQPAMPVAPSATSPTLMPGSSLDDQPVPAAAPAETAPAEFAPVEAAPAPEQP